MSNNKVGECLDAQNDNVYIHTRINNMDESARGVPAVYNDSRQSDIVDDACRYDINVAKFLMPRHLFPIKHIDPIYLASNPTVWDYMPEAIRIQVGQNVEEQNLIWEAEVYLPYRQPYEIPSGDASILLTDKSYAITKYPNYYSLYSFRHFTKIMNKTFLLIHNNIKQHLDTTENKDIPPFMSCDDNDIIRLHLPEAYISANNTNNIPVISFNQRLQFLFNGALPFLYGRLGTYPPPEIHWNILDTSPQYAEWLTDYDTSKFVAPFTNIPYTYNRNERIQYNFKSHGGFDRIQIYSNIPLVKKEYTQKQDIKSGSVLNNESTQENILQDIYINYNQNLKEELRYDSGGYPLWKSIANTGALNRISYSVYVVDNYGNRFPVLIPYGCQITLILQLRRVI